MANDGVGLVEVVGLAGGTVCVDCGDVGVGLHAVQVDFDVLGSDIGDVGISLLGQSALFIFAYLSFILFKVTHL